MGWGRLGGAVAAAVLLYMATFFVGPHVEGLLGSVGQNAGFLLFVGGAGVVGTMMAMPNGIAGKVQDSWQAYLNKKAARLSASERTQSGVRSAPCAKRRGRGEPGGRGCRAGGSRHELRQHRQA